TKQCSSPLRPYRDDGKADPPHELPVERGAQRKRSHWRHAFAHAIGAPCKASGAEGFSRKPRQSLSVAIGFEADFKGGGRHRSRFQQADQEDIPQPQDGHQTRDFLKSEVSAARVRWSAQSARALVVGEGGTWRASSTWRRPISQGSVSVYRATQAPLAKFHEIVEVHQVLSSLRHTFESATLKADARSGTFEASGGNIDG